MVQEVKVFRIAMSGPSDTTGLQELLDKDGVSAADIVAVLCKTEGNGCVNDFTRGYATLAFSTALADRLSVTPSEVRRRVAFVMSGGTEGVMSPHATVFVRSERDGAPPAGKRLAVGVSFTRDFLPEEIGRMEMVHETAAAVQEAMTDAGISDPADVHLVQIKCPLLTAERMEDSHHRGKTVATDDTYKSMGYSRGASALGVAVALGEVPESQVSAESILHDWSVFSAVASTSAGIEMLRNEIILLGNSETSASDYIIEHSVMQDAIDGRAVREALHSAGVPTVDGEVGPEDAKRVINVIAKSEADPSGEVRGRRHIMLDDSDINSTRHARAVVNAVIASIVGDPMVYVSGGAEHQGPAGGGPVAVIARVEFGS